MRATLLLGILTTAIAVGCANLNSIHHPFSVRPKNPESIAIDAKQRVVYSREFITGGNADRTILCAEPSPDALSALATALAGDVDISGYGSLAGSYTSTESAMNIGLRTQTIQLLRDAMYRLCEAYFNSGIESGKMAPIIDRYQDAMVALLAIEQLTGAATPRPAVAIASSTGQAGLNLNAIQEQIDAAEKEQKSKQDTATKLDETIAAKRKIENDDSKKSEHAGAAADREKAQEELETTNKSLADLEKNIKALKVARDNARFAATSATAGAILPPASSAATMTPALAEKVSGTVKDIVTAYLDNSEEAQCLGLIRESPPTPPSKPKSTDKTALDLWRAETDAFIALNKARTSALERCNDYLESL